jgi:DNA invertase Pin-like site-specific DNA recombinase
VGDEHGISNQIEHCQKFAVQKGFTIAGIYQDETSGTTPMAARPRGWELQQAIKQGEVEAVIVARVDRLSRDISDLIATIQDCLHAGVEIYALNEGEITSCFKTLITTADQTYRDKNHE